MNVKEKKRARGSSSTAEDDISDAMILEKLSNIHDDIKALKQELKGEIKAVRAELSSFILYTYVFLIGTL